MQTFSKVVGSQISKVIYCTIQVLWKILPSSPCFLQNDRVSFRDNPEERSLETNLEVQLLSDCLLSIQCEVTFSCTYLAFAFLFHLMVIGGKVRNYWGLHRLCTLDQLLARFSRQPVKKSLQEGSLPEYDVDPKKCQAQSMWQNNQ